jgi:glycosyltransferase involved in cell wall biosynthesis
MFEALAPLALGLALLPALLTAWNLALYRAPPRSGKGTRPRLSLLIPARDEEAQIGPALRAALESRGVDLEVVVLDDHSSDGTRAVVAALTAADPRIRLELAPPLPPGWSGKQHACQVLAERARHDLLVFVDADVRLAPDALARIAAFMGSREIGLASGFPRQETGTFGERLIVPLIHFLLLGFLPLARMRRSLQPALGAGCGQLICVRREAYERAGGHAAIRASLHDGLMLPRAFRRAGIMTDLFDATELASCRMYRGLAEVWRGFAKNATEGMARPAALPVWTVLLLGGQVLPFVLVPASVFITVPGWAAATSVVAAACVYLNRLVLALRFRQSAVGALLHPLGIVGLLALQWIALIDQRRGRPAVWRGRAYSS